MSFILCALLTANQAVGDDYCWREAGQKYGISPQLLMAISWVESRHNPSAIGKNNTSVDYGHAQINSWWLPTLEKHGIGREDLFKPCIATHVSAWILAQNIARYGYTWEAIGAYNASERNPGARKRYVWRVFNALARFEERVTP